MINEKTDIYLVNSYGKTKSFFSLCNNVFLGGSIIKHGGQNPLEAVRYGCNILHGPNVSNFSEIYNFLKRNKIAIRVNKKENMIYTLNKLFKKKTNLKKIKNKLNMIGKKILTNTYKKINLIANLDEI